MAVAPEVSMEVSQGNVEWNRSKFLELRQTFLNNRCETHAFDVLHRLVNISPDAVDDEAWLDCKDLILLLLEEIHVELMLMKEQVLLLNVIQNGPTRIVSLLANFYSKKPQATPFLGGAAIAVSVAFARRINDSDTFEDVSLLLSPVAHKPEILTELLHQLEDNKDSEHRFRVYQVLLCCLQNGSYTPTMLPLLEKLAGELEGNDVLVQLAAMDVLCDIAIANTESASVLTQTGITQKIYDTLVACSNSPDGGFLFTSCVKFFGSLCHCYPEAITAFPAFVPRLFNMVRNYHVLDVTQRMLSVETLSQVAFTEMSKQLLEEQEGLSSVEAVVASLTSAASSGPEEMRERVLEAITLILQNGSDELLSRWFSWMSDLPSILSAYVTRPFPELRLAAIKCVSVLMSRQFGVEAMLTGSRNNLESFKDWLCDAKSESDWEASRQKSQLVRSLRDANWTCVDSLLAARFRAYFQKAAQETEVATMEL